LDSTPLKKKGQHVRGERITIERGEIQKRIIKGKRRKYLNNMVLQMEQDFKANRPKETYKAVNVFKKG